MPESKVAVMFPGQGAFDGQALLAANQQYPHVAQVFKEIDEVTTDLYGRRLSDVLFEAGPVDIRQLLDDDPWVAQLAIFGADVSAYHVLADHGLRPDVLLGHSLGEIAALVAAQVFTIGDGARIVAERVRVIQELGLTNGGMVALSVDTDRAKKIIELIADPLMAVATENHDGQTVISGPRTALERVLAVAGPLQVGAVELNAPFPFHTPILRPAVPVFADRIRSLPQRPAVLPVYSPILQRYYQPDDVLAELLADHFVLPVPFSTAIRRLHQEGVGVFVESGGKAALSALVTKALPGSTVTTWPSLAVDRSGALALDRTLAGLREAGLLSTPRTSLGLTGGTIKENFERFWARYGAEFIELLQTKLIEFDRSTGGLEAASGDASGVNGFGTTAAAEVAASAPLTEEQATPPAEHGSVVTGTGVPPTAADDQLDRHALAAEIRAIYSDALEYPDEVFTDDVLLEAELGVDSVKQIELLTRVSQRYGLPPRESGFRLSDYDTMGKIVDYVHAEVSRSGARALAA